MPDDIATTDDVPERFQRDVPKAWVAKTVYARDRIVERCDRFSLDASTGPILVGRQPEQCGLILTDGSVTAKHARLTRTSEGWQIEDVGSRHGTRVNGEYIRTPTRLDHDTMVALGGTVLIFCREGDVAGGGPLGDILGDSAAIRRVRSQIRRSASQEGAVYLSGETGTGKELCARAIHNNGPRANKPFVAVNCAGIPKDLFERELFGHARGSFTGAGEDRAGFCQAAHGGTLFLDEFGELTLDLQAKLLRVLQDKQVLPIGATKPVHCDFRVIVATSKNLRTLVDEGRFREDLYQRVSQTEIVLPPLRQRRSDILPLAARFLGAKSPAILDARFAQAMVLYDWPGNVRELQNVVERIKMFDESIESDVEFGDTFVKENLPDSKRPDPAPAEVVAALSANDDNETQAAKVLGIHRSKLQRLVKKYEIRR
jgi:DNA-binding NtrC family response regulator